MPLVPSVDDEADGGAAPYRAAPLPADPAGDPEARKKRRRARRVRRVRKIAAAVGLPVVAIGAWIAGAHAEVGARARRDADRALWWKEQAQVVIDREAAALAKVTDAEPFDLAYRNRLAGHDWAAVAFAAARPDGSAATTTREAQGSKSMSSFGAPGGSWGNSLSVALGTAPWRWIIVGGTRPDPLFLGRLLPGEKRVLVAVVDRLTGALLCQGIVDVGWSSYTPACATSDLEAWDDRIACAAATQRSFLAVRARTLLAESRSGVGRDRDEQLHGPLDLPFRDPERGEDSFVVAEEDLMVPPHLAAGAALHRLDTPVEPHDVLGLREEAHHGTALTHGAPAERHPDPDRQRERNAPGHAAQLRRRRERRDRDDSGKPTEQGPADRVLC